MFSFVLTPTRIIFILLLALILFRPVSIAIEHKHELFEPGYAKLFKTFRADYFNSQYVKKINPSIIPDNTLEAYAGGAFLKGENPILIVHDQPPLGRYIIGLSIILFDNPSTVAFMLLCLSGLGVYLLGNLVFKNPFLALIPFGIFINEPLFTNKMLYLPILEPIQLPFILFSLFAFIKGVTARVYNKWFILFAVFLGCVISIRYFILGVVLLGSCALYFFVKKQFDKRFFTFALALPLSLVVLVLSYFKTIQLGYSVLQIFGVQKYIFYYHQSAFVHAFSFWGLLLLNRWQTWWGTQAISFDQQWIIAWPVATILVFVAIPFIVFRKISIEKSELVLLLWIVGYSAMLSAGYTSTRYFLPLLPCLYIVGLSMGIKLFRYFFVPTSQKLRGTR